MPWRANQAYVWIVIGFSSGGFVAGQDRLREAVAVALRRQVALELRDEEAAVGEDEDAEVARSLDEAGGGDRLARGGRVAEPVPADAPGSVPS